MCGEEKNEVSPAVDPTGTPRRGGGGHPLGYFFGTVLNERNPASYLIYGAKKVEAHQGSEPWGLIREGGMKQSQHWLESKIAHMQWNLSAFKARSVLVWCFAMILSKHPL